MPTKADELRPSESPLTDKVAAWPSCCASLEKHVFTTGKTSRLQTPEYDADKLPAQVSPTPMLDWTLLPFAALFFAFEDEMRLDSDGKLSSPDNRAVFALSTSVISENAPNSAPRLFSPTAETSHRLVAQSGLFLKMPEKTDLQQYIQAQFTDESSQTIHHARAVLIKIVIKDCDRSGCLKMLNKMNINRMTLFPDLDGASRYINALWEIDFDTSLGYIGNESP